MEKIIYILQYNGFETDTIPILLTSKSLYNNIFLWCWKNIINKINVKKLISCINTKIDNPNFEGKGKYVSPILNAIYSNSYDRVKFLLDAGATVNNNVLIFCLLVITNIEHKDNNCEKCNLQTINNVKIIDELCKKNLDLNMILNSDLDNIIMIAIKFKYYAVVDIFCKYDFDVNHKNKDNKTVMSLAIEYNCPLICYKLWKKGADINSVDDKNHTFLMSIISNNLDHLIEEVLQNKTDINAKDLNGANALSYVCIRDNPQPEIIELLIRYGSDIFFSLMNALRKNNACLVSVLCSLKDNINYHVLFKYAKKIKNSNLQKLCLEKLKTN
jgi:ankyrin repeat protein